jgi:hypothetical protein
MVLHGTKKHVVIDEPVDAQNSLTIRLTLPPKIGHHLRKKMQRRIKAGRKAEPREHMWLMSCP